MAAPRYVQRLARLPRILARVAASTDGLQIGELAEQEGVAVAELREDLLAYYTADADQWMMGLTRPSVIEFLAPDGAECDPDLAEVVRVVDPGAVGEIGVEHLAAHELALVYTAALGLLEVEPDDDLASAIDVLAETMFEAPDQAPRTGHHGDLLPVMRDAIAQRRRVDIVYSRQWAVGITERVIEPYGLVHTRRGWEVDAGPPDAQGRLRTYLVSNLRTVTPTEATFDPPPHLEERLREQRLISTVRMTLRHDARWAADMYAESVEVVEEDEDTFTADLAVLPPVAGRVGLITLAAGEETRVHSPSGLVSAGPGLAAELYDHHAGSGGVDVLVGVPESS